MSDLAGCIRTAAKADAAHDIASARRAAPDLKTSRGAQALPPARVNYVKQLGLPALGLGLSAALTAGLALPGMLVGAVIAAAAVPHALRAVEGFCSEKRLTVEVLDVTAVALLLAQSSFLAPAVMMAVIEGAEVIRTWTARRGRLPGLDQVLPPEQAVPVERNGQQERIPAEEIVPGDIVLVGPGERVPVDGAVLDGNALIDAHELTGDATLIAGERGVEVRAATRLAEGHLRIQATRTGRDTGAAHVLASALAVSRPDTRVSNYARRTGNPGVVPTLLVGGTVGTLSASLGRATGIVSLDFGLGMRVSAPIAILTAQVSATRNGILVRSGRAMEMLAQVGAVVLCFSRPGPEDGEVIAALREMHKVVFVASGESNSTVEAATADLGLDPAHTFAALLPQEKADIVTALQASGKRVMVVGDGINDAAALAHADVAISFGSASALARETADVVLLRDDLRDVLVAMQIARHALRLIKQNQAIVVGLLN